MLDRVSGEVARATSLVRYAPASTFPAHEHALASEQCATIASAPRLPLKGYQRTLKHVRPMSALPPKADIHQREGNVRFVPKADIAQRFDPVSVQQE